MIFLYIITAILLLLSILKDKRKTVKALKIAWKKFKNILPAFIGMLVLVSIVLFLVPNEVILKYLGTQNLLDGLLIASFFGSITVMPGFIAYPLSGILLEQGVPYTVLAAFVTTLMMVGVVTFPVEQKFLGTKIAIVRNIIGLIIALIVSLCIGLFYGEISL
jgi:uncharacterized membrane protein YraQ (UPF0718 family)